MINDNNGGARCLTHTHSHTAVLTAMMPLTLIMLVCSISYNGTHCELDSLLSTAAAAMIQAASENNKLAAVPLPSQPFSQPARQPALVKIAYSIR